MDYSYFYVGFQGILFFQVFLMLSQAFVNQRKEYYYYIFYILLLMVYCHAMWSTYGIGLESYKFNPSLEPYLDKPVVMLSFFMYLRFARNFLEIPIKFQGLNKKIRWLEYILLGYALIEVLLLLSIGEGKVNEFIYHCFSAFNLALSIWCVIVFVRKQKTPLNYFIIAGGSTIVIGAIISLLLIVFKPSLPFPVITVFPCFVLFEITIFTTGLAYKSKIVERQKFLSERKLLEESIHKEHLQRNILELRNKIAGDLHDDLGSTLGSLGIFAEAGKKSLEVGSVDKASNIFEKMHLLAIDSLKNLREMVWVITPGNEKWKDLNDKMENYGRGVLQSKNISFSIDSEVDEQLSLSVVQRRNLYLIFKECIHNIIKHSQAKHVAIKATFNPIGNFTFSVQDDGLGKKKEIAQNGYGLKSMFIRAQELNGNFVLEDNAHSGIIITVDFPIQFQFSKS